MKYFLALCLAVLTLPPLAGEPKGTADFKYESTRDYRDKNPGLGRSWKFSGEYGWVDVYRYDMGRGWDAGVTPDLKKHLEIVYADIESVKKSGAYKSCEAVSSTELTIGKIPFICVKFEIVRDDGKAYESYMYLTALDDEILKIRISLYRPADAKAKSAILEFVKTAALDGKKKTGPKGAFGFKCMETYPEENETGHFKNAVYTFRFGQKAVFEEHADRIKNRDSVSESLAADIAEISNAQDRGVYKSALIGKLEETSLSGAKFLHARVRLESPEGGKWIELGIYLTVRSGRLLKFKAIMPESADEKDWENLENFIAFRMKQAD